MVKLVLPPGVAHDYPISHGDRDYLPGAYREDHTDPSSNWIVDVPPHVAIPLLHKGGAYMAEHTRVMHSAGDIELIGPGGAPGSCSVKGHSVASRERADGVHVFDVPIEFAAEMRPHGYSPAPPLDENAGKKRPKARAADQEPAPTARVAPAQVPSPEQTREGGGARLVTFPKDGEHPDGGPQTQPAGDDGRALQAAQSRPAPTGKA